MSLFKSYFFLILIATFGLQFASAGTQVSGGIERIRNAKIETNWVSIDIIQTRCELSNPAQSQLNYAILDIDLSNIQRQEIQSKPELLIEYLLSMNLPIDLKMELKRCNVH